MLDEIYTINEEEFPTEIKLEQSEMFLIKGFQKGELNAEEQKRVFDIICKKICRLGFNPYMKGDAGQTAFNSGIQKVGHVLVTLAVQSLTIKKENK